MAENRLSSSLGFTPSGPRTDIKITTLTIVVAAIFLFLTVIFVFLLYFYAKYYWGSRPPRPRPRRRHLPHFIFSAGNPSVPNRGLDPSVLSSLPITLYKPSDFNEGIECAVCLSELAAGEEARLLPKCGHGFHLECIDLWFQSNSTCPICRCAVEVYGNRSDEPTDLPANVLFWGNRNRVDSGEGNSGSSERVLVISIPVRSTEGFLSASGSPLEEKRSPATPKMWSFRRILSRGKMAGGSSSSSPRVCDIEQGMVGSGAEIGEGSSS